MARSHDEAVTAAFEALGIAACLFDGEDAVVHWNAAFLEAFPEHAGCVFPGEPYSALLLRAPSPIRAANDAIVASDIWRTHRGEPLVAVTLPVSRRRSLRLWQRSRNIALPSLADLAARAANDALAPTIRTRKPPLVRRDGATRASERALLRLHAKLETTARMDAVTGLSNRRGFEPPAEDEWRRAARSGAPVAILRLSLDRFQRLNDRLGHATGDECLRRVGLILQDVTRAKIDHLVHYGAGDFAIALPGSDLEAACSLAEAIRQEIGETDWRAVHRGIGFITASIGVAAFTPKVEPMTLTAALRQAAASLRLAARHGGDRVETAPADDRSTDTTVVPFTPRRAFGRD